MSGRYKPVTEKTPEEIAKRNAWNRAYRARHRERLNERRIELRDRDREHERALSRASQARHKDARNERRRDDRAANAERERPFYRLEYHKRRAERTPDEQRRINERNNASARRRYAAARAEERRIMAEMDAQEADALATFVPDAEVLGVASAHAKRRDKMHQGRTHAATVAMRQAARAARPVPVMLDETPIVYGQRRYNSFPKRTPEVIEMVAERLIVQAPAEPAHNYRDAAYGRWAAHNPVHAIVKARKQGSDGRHE